MNQKSFILKHPILTMLLVNICMYMIAFLFVRYYYSIGLPYYDSVGSYVQMFSVANTTRRLGFLAGIGSAIGYPLSWIQSFFAVFSSYILPNKPEWFIILNFLLLFLAQYSIYLYVKNVYSSRINAFVLSFLPFFPGALMGWVGGYIDMRRDSSFLSLLIAGFFLFLDYTHSKKSYFSKGMLVGVLWGFTQWSRGNALPYWFCIIGPVIMVNIFRISQRKEILKYFISLIIPFSVAIIISFPFYYYNWQAIYEKYVFGSWGIGVDRLNAMYIFIKQFPILSFGPDRSTLLINTIYIFGLCGLIIFFLRKKLVKLDKTRLKSFRFKSLLYIGILIIILMFILNGVLLGVGDYLFPNFPVLVGVMSIVIYLTNGTKISYPISYYKLNTDLVLSLWIICILLANTLRMFISMPQNQQQLVISTKKSAADLGPILGGKRITYMWLDHINVHDLNFYITQDGNVPIYAPSLLLPGVDTEMPPNPSKSVISQQEEYAKGMRVREYVIVTEDLKSYENPKGFFFILRYGGPIVENIIHDPEFEKIYTFSDLTRNYQVLKNKKFNKDLHLL